MGLKNTFPQWGQRESEDVGISLSASKKFTTPHGKEMVFGFFMPEPKAYLIVNFLSKNHRAVEGRSKKALLGRFPPAHAKVKGGI